MLLTKLKATKYNNNKSYSTKKLKPSAEFAQVNCMYIRQLQNEW